MTPEWLTRDPLNGLIVTIAFFISLVIGRYLREKRQQGAFRNKMMDSRIKLIVSFLLIISITLMKHWYLPTVIAILCAVAARKLHVLRDYGKKLSFPLVLAFFIMAIQALTYGATVINLRTISVYAEGMDYGFLIFSRVLASASVMVLLITTTSENALLETMRWFRVPGTLIDISSFMVRYIRSFSQAGRQLKLAQESRCGFRKKMGFTRRMQNAASICAALITCSFARSEEVYRAMVSRAWDPAIRFSADIPPLNRGDKVLGIILSTGITGLVIFDRFL